MPARSGGPRDAGRDAPWAGPDSDVQVGRPPRNSSIAQQTENLPTCWSFARCSNMSLPWSPSYLS
eukprot:scaffold520900_cov15-Prasinocladus_malaysianus.AAC.1